MPGLLGVRTAQTALAALACAAPALATPIGLMSAEREARWAGCVTPHEGGPARAIAIWPSEPGFIVEYPGSGCSGWHMPAPLENWVDAHERLTTGPDGAAACMSSGDQVVYTIEDGALRLQFFNDGARSAQAWLTPRPDHPECMEARDQ